MEKQAAETLHGAAGDHGALDPAAGGLALRRSWAGVAVAKAVMWNSKLVLLLDEPTAALGVVQTRMVLDLVKRLQRRAWQ